MAVIDGYKPQGEKFLVEEIKKGEKKAGSIIMLEGGSYEFQIARVVKRDPAFVKYNEGDIVMYQKGAGLNQTIGAKAYLWLNINEIWSGLDEEAAADFTGILTDNKHEKPAGDPENSKIITAN